MLLRITCWTFLQLGLLFFVWTGAKSTAELYRGPVPS